MLTVSIWIKGIGVAVKLVPLFMEAHNMKLSVNSSVSVLSLTIATLSLMWLYYKAVPDLQIIYKSTPKNIFFIFRACKTKDE